MTTIDHNTGLTKPQLIGARAPGLLGGWMLRLYVPALFLALWSAVSLSMPGNASTLPPPHQVLTALWRETITGTLPTHVGVSLLRAFGGFVVAGGVGMALGLLMSQSRVIQYLLAGPIELLRPISLIAWIPLAILWFGLGYQSVVFVIAISCIFIVLINTLAAALRIDPDLVKAALTLGAGRWALFCKVIVPNALPGILLGLRIALSGAWGGVLVAEMIATQQGLGYMILRAQAAFRADLVIGGMLVVGVVGYLLNVLFLRLQRWIVHA